MTLANFVLNEKLAVAFTDTAIFDSDGRMRHRVTKVHVAPHLQAALVVRGLHGLSKDIAAWLLGDQAFPDGLDEAIDLLPAFAAARHGYWTARIGEDVPTGIFLTGWSPAQSRMRLITWFSFDNWETVEREPGVYAWPEVSADPKLSAPTLDLRQAVALADAQRSMMAETARRNGGGDVAIGGELVATQITPEEIKVRTVHRWAEDDITLSGEAE